MPVRHVSLVLAALAAALPLAAQDAPLIYVDPGHGGEQSGVVADGLHEKDLVLRWGFLLAEALAEAGYETRMSRTGDVTLGFADRIADAEAQGAALVLSLHINGDDDPEKWGTELFVAEDRPASVAAAEAIGRALETTGAQVELIGQPWAVLKSERSPTVMIELGHLTHPVERRLMLSRDYWVEVSRAIVSAVEGLVGAPGR